jgi:enamine deaminase RidA (YjgF/YER057c/UK114 family)
MTDDLNGPIRRLNPPELGTPPGYSQIVEVRGGRIIFIAGQTALNREGELIGKNDFAAQAGASVPKPWYRSKVCGLHGKQLG